MGQKTGTYEDTKPFGYVFGEKENVIVVIFSGKMASTDSAVIEQCAAVLADKPQPVVIVSFVDVVDYAAVGVFTPFARFQKALRDLGKHLGICGVGENIKAQFHASGIVRENELFTTVAQAWQALKGHAQPVPSDVPVNGKADVKSGSNAA